MEKKGCGYGVLSQVTPALRPTPRHGWYFRLRPTRPLGQKPCFDVISQAMRIDTSQPDGLPPLIEPDILASMALPRRNACVAEVSCGLSIDGSKIAVFRF
jgi:hypothetical protein